MSYIGTEPKDIRSFGRTKFDYTATQGQTAFTGADDDGKVLAFTVGQIEVYVNGILMDDSDFTTTGTGTVTLASAANLNDVINIVSFESNIPDNDYVPASGGTFTGNVTNSGAVTNSGNVTVGGTLGVTGAVTASNGLTVDDDGATVLTVDRATSNGDVIDIQKDGTSVGTIGANGSNLYIGSPEGTDAYIGFGNNIVRPVTSAGASRDNAIDLGYTGMRFKDLYLSGGAYIGGTGAGNKFDMYDEGTYTISERHGQATITNNRVHYTRIGNLVFVAASIEVGSNSNGNVLNLTLPFASSINGYYLGGGNTSYTSLSSTYKDNLKVNVENAADNVFFTYSNANTNLTCANASGARIDFFCMYHT